MSSKSSEQGTGRVESHSTVQGNASDSFERGTKNNPISWREALGGPFLVFPTAQMLDESGELKLRYVGVKGESKYLENRPDSRWFHYGRDYVVGFMERKLRGILYIASPETLTGLILEAKKLNEQMKGDENR